MRPYPAQTTIRGASRAGRHGTLAVAGIVMACVCGFVMIVLGALILWDEGDRRARHNLVMQLPDLRSTAVGATGLLEGRINERTPPLHDEFVAYLREQYQSSSARTSSWHPLEQKTQPFVVDAEDRRYLIANANYRFDRAITDWTPHSRELSSPTLTRGTTRISGLVAGGSVMIIGHAVASDGKDQGGGGQLFDRRIVADSIAGVDRATYLADLQSKRANIGWFATAMLLSGVLATLYGMRGVARIMRNP